MTVTVLMTTALCVSIVVLALFSASILREQAALCLVRVRADERRLRTRRER